MPARGADRVEEAAFDGLCGTAETLARLRIRKARRLSKILQCSGAKWARMLCGRIRKNFLRKKRKYVLTYPRGFVHYKALKIARVAQW